MRLLVTRAREDATALAKKLTDMGHEPLLHPLIDIELLELPKRDWRAFSAVIVTSKNALRALAGCDAKAALVTLPLICIGPGTAALARSMGLQTIIEGQGTAASLAGFLRGRGFAPGARLLYLAGADTAFDLSAALGQAGYAADKIVVYKAAAIRSLDPEMIVALKNGELDGVILMSPRTARIYRRLIERHRLASNLQGVRHYCLSGAVAAQLQALPCEPVIAAQPNEAAMLGLIHKSASENAQQRANF